jgi:hypothetical protein
VRLALAPTQVVIISFQAEVIHAFDHNCIKTFIALFIGFPIILSDYV